ncbi:hypothetical protein Ciccas_005861 [Cichlidogyrus casuarinus]|uniref:Uncharacterized protein n=1 Tax=Cichlidogyrus casuarinus TaxID=1844966 RepID=A0ABD2Q7F5_9PLAT
MVTLVSEGQILAGVDLATAVIKGCFLSAEEEFCSNWPGHAVAHASTPSKSAHLPSGEQLTRETLAYVDQRLLTPINRFLDEAMDQLTQIQCFVQRLQSINSDDCDEEEQQLHQQPVAYTSQVPKQSLGETQNASKLCYSLHVAAQEHYRNRDLAVLEKQLRSKSHPSVSALGRRALPRS